MPIPLTKTRLATSLTLIAVHQTTDDGLPFDFSNAVRGIANLAEFASSLTFIGATNVFRINQSGTNYRRRGINSPREPFALIPGVSVTTIEMERATLYFEDAMAGFKFLPGNIAHQTRPLIIIENVTAPTDGRGEFSEADAQVFARSGAKKIFEGVTGLAGSPLFYLNCWINQSRINYDLKGSDQAVLQNITLDVGRITTPAGLIPRIGDPIVRRLTEASSIISAVQRVF